MAQWTGDGMTAVSGRLPAEEAAIVSAALIRARDLNAPPPSDPAGDGAGTPRYRDVDGFLDICRHYLETAGADDESGEDRSIVVVEVAAEQLIEPASEPGDVPAGTPPAASETCTIRGNGGIEPETARRLSCTGSLLGAVIDRKGDVLALGSSRRLVSKAQRRALMLRDQACQFPGCSQTRHLQAHHVISWSRGGPTDLENLILLCRFHHLCVHEGGIAITRNGDVPFAGATTGAPAWLFTMPNGERVDRPNWPVPSAQDLTYRLARVHDVDHVDRLDHPDALVIRPKQYGERFDLDAAARVLFDLQQDLGEAA
ncbi:HNH endonuclease signature motif containing protein [Microlunatus parietis]|uniref:HNH endonuclease signature motif containing protein n=1 Tax=Microlunatus parietis TaxID=682979 RepID=UPI0035E418BF